MFENDRIVEFPQFEMDGRVTPDISQIRTRTPLPSGKNSASFWNGLHFPLVRDPLQRVRVRFLARHACRNLEESLIHSCTAPLIFCSKVNLCSLNCRRRVITNTLVVFCY